MTPQELKSSILQLAIQGKLVEQRPEEGTGEELYRQIQAEKQALIKAGKIKKEKPLPEIAADEVPFEIPESWKWVRWGEIVNIVSARRVHQSDWKMEGIPFYRAREIAKLATDGHVENELFDNRSFLVRRTLGLLCVLALGLVIALPLYDPVLLLDLRNVQGRNLETAVLENIRLDLLVGCAPLKLGDIQPLKREFDLHRAMWICSLGKAHYRFHRCFPKSGVPCRADGHIHRPGQPGNSPGQLVL